jgi:hypothetical protein
LFRHVKPSIKVITELWSPRGGAYNVDGVLSVMVRGLEEELRARMSGELGGSYGMASITLDSTVLLDAEHANSDEDLSQNSLHKVAVASDTKKTIATRKRKWLRKLLH